MHFHNSSRNVMRMDERGSILQRRSNTEMVVERTVLEHQEISVLYVIQGYRSEATSQDADQVSSGVSNAVQAINVIRKINLLRLADLLNKLHAVHGTRCTTTNPSCGNSDKGSSGLNDGCLFRMGH